MYTYEKEAVIEEAPVAEATDIDVGNSRLGLGVIMVMAAFVGLWGAGCLIHGLATLPSLKIAIKTLLISLLGV